ncbi:FecR family protein [Paraflavitalea sp. CAU 1676]|uniref:FecR family protein n=1 Tax=Paraflavitalea sp. CAU 1676 TaxID=3032598 RepID=UPI0023DC915D|nr:FecR family protein [Paraflavitalea sp. CAU 1676]MDF2188202.1 FecR domain-containing protein [Paraflavitalea sp. CAU 1676]
MNRFETLWKGYREGLLTEAELAEFLHLIRENDSPLPHKIDELLQETTGNAAPGEKEIILQQLRQRISQPQQRVVRLNWLRRNRWAAAAVFLLLTGAITWFSLQQHNNAITVKGRPSFPVYDAAPGKSGAILTLADGSQLVLDSAGQGTVATQGNTQVLLHDGQLNYQQASKETPSLTATNTISTPRGRQFQVVLPDGTRVWLNAGSSLTYPVAFTGNERKVTMKGEAYFEVATLLTATHKMPFIVETGSMAVEVLGTHFNINAYADEPSIKTTLLEGKVRVRAQATAGKTLAQEKILQPGEQAMIASAGQQASGAIRIQQVDVDQVVAWKNGLFNFQKADLPTVMRQLARWYDVEVQYRGPVPDRLFGGEIERNLQLSQVIKILKRMGIECSIEDKKLIVH